MVRIINIIFLSIFILLSCNKNENTPPQNDYPFDLQGINDEFISNVAYDIYDNTKFDIWLPGSQTPTGLVIYFHGGGFTSGDKSVVYEKDKWDFPTEIRTLLSNNIAFASVNYRLLSQTGENEGILKCLNDSKRALQYIRNNAETYNIDKTNIVLSGTSAGAGTALWIGVNDDLMDAQNSDPVLQQSTRVKALALRETQSSYNIEDKWINDVFVDYGITWNDFLSAYQNQIFQLYGVASLTEYESSTTDTYRNTVDMLEMITSDDPEIFAENILTNVSTPNTSGKANHHAYHVREIKERADLAGVQNVCYYGKNPIIYSALSEETYLDFIIRKINE